MDVFVTVACHIAKGGLLNVIGKEIDDLKRNYTIWLQLFLNDLRIIKGNIIYIDHFGNCVTNISKKMFDEVA